MIPKYNYYLFLLPALSRLKTQYTFLLNGSWWQSKCSNPLILSQSTTITPETGTKLNSLIYFVMEQVWLNDMILLSSGYLSSLNSLWGEVMRAHFWIFVVSHFSTSPTLWSHWLVTAAFNMTWISWLWRRNGRWMNSWWWLQEKIHVPPKWDICMNILSTSRQFVLYVNAITSKITIIKISFPHSNYSQFSILQLQ